MPSLSQSLPNLPLPATAGGHPTGRPKGVRSGSTRRKIKFEPLARTRDQARKEAAKRWHRARDFDRQEHQAGRHGGKLGRVALAVLHSLLFDHLNPMTGQLDPGHKRIATQAGLCERAVRTGLNRLREAGIVAWVRRCSERRTDNGSFYLEQDTNAYSIRPESEWRGYKKPAGPPTPAPGTWGKVPIVPDPIDQAIAERRQGGTPGRQVDLLKCDPSNPLDAALARLGQGIATRDASRSAAGLPAIDGKPDWLKEKEADGKREAVKWHFVNEIREAAEDPPQAKSAQWVKPWRKLL